MWQIKHIDKNTKKEKVLKGRLSSEEVAQNYLNEHYKDMEDVWVEEKGAKKSKTMDMSDKKGLWLWIYSNKKSEFFPYGIVVDYTSQFVKIKTKDGDIDYSDLSDMRVERIKDMIETDKAKFLEEGHFVVIKEYL